MIREHSVSVVRAVLRYIDVAIGTEEEIKAATLTEMCPHLAIEHSQISNPTIEGDMKGCD